MKYIFLDVDRTLLDFDAYEKIGFQTACVQFHVPWDESIYQRYHNINEALWKEYECGTVTREKLIYLRFERLFAELNIRCNAKEFEDVYQFELSQGCHYMDGALDILKYLKSKYRLFTVTNGVTATQKKKMSTAGIDLFMEHIFISGEMGSQKPQKEFFQSCFEYISDFQKEHAVIIGDSLTSDIQGGMNAGIKTCWYNPLFEKNTSTIIPNYEIHHLLELKDLL